MDWLSMMLRGSGGGGGSTADFNIEVDMNGTYTTAGFTGTVSNNYFSFDSNAVPKYISKIKAAKVTTIGQNAFASCTNLVEADFPDVQYVQQGAFTGCSKLKKIRLPSVKSISSCFSGCTTAEYIYLGPNCTSITSYSFSGVPITCKVECGFAEGAISGFPSNGGWAGNPADLNITYNVPAPTV